MKVIGIDPGKTGVIVFLNSDTCEVVYHNFKFDKNNFLDFKPVVDFIEEFDPDLIVMEKVKGRGGIGATQSFSFGFTSGQVLSLVRISKKPFKHLIPMVWQKVIHVGQNDNMTAKEKSMAVFHNLCPDRPFGDKPNKDLVDAFLIALSEIHGSYKWTFKKYCPPKVIGL